VTDWNKNIAELEAFFQVAKFSDVPIRINVWSQIIDPSLFVRSHLSIVKGQNGNERYLPYLERLQELKLILSSVYCANRQYRKSNR